MIIVLFRSRLKADAGEDYSQMAGEMYNLAKSMPGFVDFKSYKADDGERISIVKWTDQESMALWRNHPRHQEAQRLGREKWYASYEIEVAEVVRASSFKQG
jgi:heme-degrading monooxygenase HmoA